MSAAKKRSKPAFVEISAHEWKLTTEERNAFDVAANTLWDAEAMLAALGAAMNEQNFADNHRSIQTALVGVYSPIGDIANACSSWIFDSAPFTYDDFSQIDDARERLQEYDALLGAISVALDGDQIVGSNADPCRVLAIAMTMIARTVKGIDKLLAGLKEREKNEPNATTAVVAN